MRDRSIIATAWSEQQPTVLMSSLRCPRSLPLRLSTYSRGNQVGDRLGTLDTNEAVDCAKASSTFSLRRAENYNSQKALHS